MDDTPTLFRDARWLRQHAGQLLNFYYPDCIDHTHGGYVAQLSDHDGHVYDGRTKHLVATCRLVYNFSVGELLDGPDWCRSAATHGLQFLLSEHRDEDSGGFAWLLDGRDVTDGTRSCYGHAFVLLALATATKADLPGAREEVDAVYDLVDEHFWEPDHDLCRSELDADWEPTSTYRGQNANMHVCEAMLAAYEATDDRRYLDRAYAIADALARRLADRGDGLVWEHYTDDWDLDWEYNRDEPDHLFRPWGYQPGHLLEWSKLLLMLDRHREEPWLCDRAERFFESAVENGWDDEYGGFYYTFDRDGEPIVTDKYYWKLAEGIAAAALLADRTGDDRYWEWYDRFWEYAWDNVVNRKYGNWFFKLTRDNDVHPDVDQSPAVTVGYHPLSACFEVLERAV
ncbi:AGE family epimerase/isomerase [Halomicrococcus sp. SG-WS-1]|uniref:AGE family epimerase/isomerase n=1 Tax=Halomicrococcus sp. SG-WS-1 TaxID=3439057 RepID=UPI003F793E44